MPNPNLPPQPGVNRIPKWFIVLAGVVAVIGGIIYIYGKLGKQPSSKDIDKGNLPSAVEDTSAFVRGYSDGSCEGLVVRGGDGDHFYVTGTYTLTYHMKNTQLDTSKGGTDVFIAKVANNGDVVWMRSFGGTNNDVPADIEVDAQGNPLLAINYIQNLQLGPHHLTGLSGQTSGVMVKLNKTTGQPAWYSTVGGVGTIGSASISDIALAKDGNISTTGTYNSQRAVFVSATSNTTFLVNGNMQSSSAYIANYDAAGEVSSVNNFATGSVTSPHICCDRNSERILASFNFNQIIQFGQSSLGRNGVNGNMGYAFFLHDGSYVQNSAFENTAAIVTTPLSSYETKCGTVVQDVAGHFYIAGHFNSWGIRFADFKDTATQINGFVLKVNPANYTPEDLLTESGNVSRMWDVGVGAQNQILFGSSSYGFLKTRNGSGQVDLIYTATPLQPGTPLGYPSNAFIANYDNNFHKNWVHRCTSESFATGESLTWSVGANEHKIAFTGFAMDTIYWNGNLPAEKAIFKQPQDFLMVITNY